jgi:hypothetical protein
LTIKQPTPNLAYEPTNFLMKVTIPDELKKDVPQTTFGKILSATPVVMAVVATMLAGLASSEMTRAQYERSLAAQQQSKAGDQWSFFQAKRLRGAYQRNTADLLQTIIDVRPFDPQTLKSFTERLPDTGESAKLKSDLAAVLHSTSNQAPLAMLAKGELPRIASGATLSPEIQKAIEAVENLRTDAEVAEALSAVSNNALEEAVRAARDQSQAFDAATRPVNQVIEQIDTIIAGQPMFPKTGSAESSATSGSPGRDFTAARLKFAALRYELEARLNQTIANLYELQVRKSNISAERHHARSQRFFFGMLGAQLAVIISTFAMAARQRNLLWSLAATAGLLAVGFAIYVYLRL